ncbi:hypothetical protein Dimus_006206 [Dionaea muscipula]
MYVHALISHQNQKSTPTPLFVISYNHTLLTQSGVRPALKLTGAVLFLPPTTTNSSAAAAPVTTTLHIIKRTLIRLLMASNDVNESDQLNQPLIILQEITASPLPQSDLQGGDESGREKLTRRV